MKKILAWHFVSDTLRDGSPVPADGVWLKHDGPIELCSSGLHASLNPFDALQYAPGPILCRVALRGQVEYGDDKLVASERMIISRMDATALLNYFARMRALSVVHLWDATEIVLDYLMTGDESLRAAAQAAAQAASEAAAWAASDAAAQAASDAASLAAAQAAAWAASDAAARAAARAASLAAAQAAARAASDAAAQAASEAAAWAAARAASLAAAKKDFTDWVNECFEGVHHA